MDIPLIDFDAFQSGDAEARQNIAAAIGRACRDSGFFALANHGLDDAIIARAFDAAIMFFDLPEPQKAEISIDRSPCHRGWYGHGGEALDLKTQPQGDRKEGLKIGRDLPADHPLIVAETPLHGPNQWPQSWDRHDGFKAALEEAYAACETLSRQLMEAFALSLALPADYFAPMLRLPMATLSPIRYPAAVPNEGLGAGAHTDFGCLTLLMQRDEAGLEIETGPDEWLKIGCDPPHIMVNIGDMMARWTNDEYASTRHRVINKGARQRHSMAFFFDPDWDADLSPLPGCVGEGEAHYPPATCLSHLLAKIDESFSYRHSPLEGDV